jgi:hypothetical protein
MKPITLIILLLLAILLAVFLAVAGYPQTIVKDVNGCIKAL